MTINQKLDFITEGLSVRALFAYDTFNRSWLKREKKYDTYWAEGRDENGDLILTQTNTDGSASPYPTTNGGSTSNERKYYFEAALNYDRTFNSAHHVTGMMMFNLSDKVNLLAGNLVSSLPYRSEGLAGRFTYGYNDRYMAEFNFGYNGSENFNPDKRFGFFPSFGAAWVVSNESWFEPISNIVSLLKLRTSYGLVGNDQFGGTRFMFLSEMNKDAGGYTFGIPGNTYPITGGYQVSKYGVDVSWETAKKFNFGIDLNLFSDMIALNIDVFKERREDIFLSRGSIPLTMGLTGSIVGNLGIVENRGFEINTDINKKLRAIVGVNGSFARKNENQRGMDVAIEGRPDSKVYNEDGTYYHQTYNYGGTTNMARNPLAEILGTKNLQNSNNLTLSTSLEWRPINGLTLTG